MPADNLIAAFRRRGHHRSATRLIPGGPRARSKPHPELRRRRGARRWRRAAREARTTPDDRWPTPGLPPGLPPCRPWDPERATFGDLRRPLATFSNLTPRPPCPFRRSSRSLGEGRAAAAEGGSFSEGGPSFSLAQARTGDFSRVFMDLARGTIHHSYFKTK